jgi:hypothetical protein
MQAQPYRRTAKRRQTPALAAMQKGRPRFMRNPQDVKRAAIRKKRKRSRKKVRKHPLNAILASRSRLTQ